MRYIVTGGVLLATVGWLVLSYMPGNVEMLPRLAFGDPAFVALFPWLAGLTLTVFLVIQFDLVRVTERWFRQPERTSTAKAIIDFNLRRNRELFWTVLPAAGTALLGIWLLMVR